MESVWMCRRSLAGLTAALVLLGSVAGCASDGEEKSPAVAMGGATAADIELPVDEYSLSVPEIGRLLRARRLLTSACMRRFGFDTPAELAMVDLAARNRLKDLGFYGNKRRYGVTLMEVAQKYGYHLVSVVDGTAQPVLAMEKSRSARSADPAERLALTGNSPTGSRERPRVNGRTVPQGGCSGEADAEVAPTGPLGDAQLVSRIGKDSYEQSLTDPAVTGVFSAWSACMRARGFSYPDPTKAGADFKVDSRTVSPKEIATAKADVTCKTRTHLVEIWQSFETRNQRAQIDRHRREFKRIKKDHDTQLKRAIRHSGLK